MVAYGSVPMTYPPLVRIVYFAYSHRFDILPRVVIQLQDNQFIKKRRVLIRRVRCLRHFDPSIWM